jgi:hypothetical protein
MMPAVRISHNMAINLNCEMYLAVKVYRCLFAQRALSNSEDECSHVQLLYEAAQVELQKLAEINEDQAHDMRSLNEKLQVCCSSLGHILICFILLSSIYNQ